MPPSLLRTNMIAAYSDLRAPDLFLSGFFVVRPGNISDTEVVTLDVQRFGEDVAPVVMFAEGPTFNKATIFTNKDFTPPTIHPAMPFDVKQFVNRLPGMTEYDASDISFRTQLQLEIVKNMQILENTISRTRETQASQILQTGLLDLLDENGNSGYTLDFQPKATHFVTVGTAWSAGGDPLLDIENMCEVIRNDGKTDADRVIMGRTSFRNFLQNTEVQAQLDNRRFEIGLVAPAPRGQGAKFQAVVNIGNYQLEVWTYSGRGIQPGDTTNTPFIADTSAVVMSADQGRLDTVFAAVPRILPIDPRFADFLPERVDVPFATDLSPNIYATADGRGLIMDVMSRPLLIPTGIDTYGNLTTE